VAHLVSGGGGACPAPLILSCPALQLDIGPILVLGEEANRRLSPLIEDHDMCACTAVAHAAQPALVSPLEHSGPLVSDKD